MSFDSLREEAAYAKKLYFYAILAGAAVLILSSTVLGFVRNEDGSGPWSALPAVLVVLAMLTYVHQSKQRTPNVYKTLDFADGFYYLGFLLTLVSLLLSLIVVNSLEGGNTNRFILSQFGIALITTVVGLSGKLLLSLYTEEEAENVEELLEEVRRSMRAARNAGEEYRSMMEGVATETQSSLTQGTEILRATVDAMKHPLANALDGLTKELQRANEKVKTSHEELGKSVDGLSSRLSASISGLTSTLQKAQEESSKLGPLFPKLMEGLLNLTAEFETLSAQTNAAKDSFGSLMTESTQVLSTSAETVARAAASLEKVTGSMLTEASRGGEAIAQRISASTKAIGDYAAELESAAKIVREVAVKPWQDAAHALAENRMVFTESIAGWAKEIDSLAEVTKRTGNRQKEASEALVSVQREVVAAVQVLREEIGG